MSPSTSSVFCRDPSPSSNLRRFDDERRRAIGEEVAKLLANGFIKKVYHSDWLSNPVLVKKENWSMEDVC